MIGSQILFPIQGRFVLAHILSVRSEKGTSVKEKGTQKNQSSDILRYLEFWFILWIQNEKGIVFGNSNIENENFQTVKSWDNLEDSIQKSNVLCEKTSKHDV